MAGRTELKSFYQTGDFPTESQFASFIDSTFNLTDDLGSANQIAYVNAGATNFAFSANLSFDGSDLTVNGNILSATWQGNAIADAYIASAATWNAKQDALSFGAQNQIPVTNSGTNDFDYSSNFSFDATRLIVNIGSNNLFLGTNAGDAAVSGAVNIFIGANSGQDISSGFSNVGVGIQSGDSLTSGADNVMIGYRAGSALTTHTNNVLIGTDAGHLMTGSGNVMIGYDVGQGLSGSNRLFIENSNSSTPLVYGEFDNDVVNIYGRISAGTDINFSSGGDYSFAGGKGFGSGSREIIASGQTSFNFSENSIIQTNGFGALANYCAILGGTDHHIASGSEYSVILGGSENTITGSDNRNAIISGGDNIVDDALDSGILAGNSNSIDSTSANHVSSCILGGNNNQITNNTGVTRSYNIIAGGDLNDITALSYVVMIGCNNVSADQEFTTYMENSCIQFNRAMYIGMPLSNDTWRINVFSNNLVFARRESGSYVTKLTMDTSGALIVASIADASAPNSSLYYSTDQARLVYKDSGGTVNNLY